MSFENFDVSFTWGMVWGGYETWDLQVILFLHKYEQQCQVDHLREDVAHGFHLGKISIENVSSNVYINL